MKVCAFGSRLFACLTLAIVCFGNIGFSFAATAEEKRVEVRKMRTETLGRLYRAHPAAKQHVQQSAGYAVFSNVGINLIFLSAAGGSGVAHDNKENRDTYMKMISGGVGIGLGVKDFRGVFVFSNGGAFKKFVSSGWEANAQADAAAKSGTKGGAVTGAITVAPGVSLYQLTENGLALQATIQGTKYYKDDDLNSK